MLKVKLYLGIILLSLVVCLVGACTSEGGDAGKFEDMKWVLESYGGQAVLADTRITATFESADHQVSGSAGCNTYFGEYKVSGDKLTISQLANTEMYCMEPEGVMDQETEYLKMLHATDSYEIRDGKLRINTDGQVLVFHVE